MSIVVISRMSLARSFQIVSGFCRVMLHDEAGELDETSISLCFSGRLSENSRDSPAPFYFHQDRFKTNPSALTRISE